jgi:hypothetical protein
VETTRARWNDDCPPARASFSDSGGNLACGGCGVRRKAPRAVFGGKWRESGSPQALTAAIIREAMVPAAQETGDSQVAGEDGKGGLLAYLKICSVKERKTFMLLMARLLPVKIQTMTVTKEAGNV